MKSLFLAALFCILGTVAAKAQWFANYTSCDVTIQQICVNTNPCQKVPGPVIVLTAGSVIPVPFTPCSTTQETMYLVCWVNCPNICTAVSVSQPQICGVPYVGQLGPCGTGCGPATVATDPTTGTVKIY